MLQYRLILIYFTFPEPLGPVMTCRFSRGLKNKSLATKEEASCCMGSTLITGWRPAFTTMGPSDWITGRVKGCGLRATRSAKEVSMSSNACFYEKSIKKC